MDDTQQANCILGICCGGDHDEKRIKALADWIRYDLQETRPQHLVDVIAAKLMARFDFAEKDTLKPLFESVAKLARGTPYQG